MRGHDPFCICFLCFLFDWRHPLTWIGWGLILLTVAVLGLFRG